MIKLTDDEFLEWCGSHKVKGCGGTRLMKGCEREVSLCEDCRAVAQLKKVVGWGNEHCPHAGPPDDDPTQWKMYCNACHQALKKEAGL